MSNAPPNVVVERRAVPDEDLQLKALMLLLKRKAPGTSGGKDDVKGELKYDSRARRRMSQQ